MTISVIVPALNEEQNIADCLGALHRSGFTDIMVSDGGSQDSTEEICRRFKVPFLHSPRGLARQINYAAELSDGENLFFVAADTRVPLQAAQEIEEALRTQYVIAGGFRLKLDEEKLWARVIEWGGNYRSSFAGFALPDQGLFIRRRDFFSLGGMDVNSRIPYAKICFEIHRRGEFYLSQAAVCASARKWNQRGVVRTTWEHIVAYRHFLRKERERPW